MASGKLKNVLSYRNSLIGLGAGMVVSFLVMAAMFTKANRDAAYDTAYLTNVGDQQVLSQTMTKFALEAAQGQEKAFLQLKRLRDLYASRFRELKEGDPASNFAPSPPEVAATLTSVENVWNTYRSDTDSILARQDAILSLGKSVSAIGENIPSLLATSDEVVELLIEQSAPQEQIYIATRQLMLTQRIGNNVAKVLAGGQGAATAADRFGRDTQLFGAVLRGMLNGDNLRRIRKVSDEDVRDKLLEVQKIYNRVHELIGKLLQESPELFLVHDSAEQMSLNSAVMLQKISALVSDYTNFKNNRKGIYVAYAAGLLTAVLVLIMGWMIVFEARHRQSDAESTSKRNQEAIMRLLNEMGDLAEGDLTVEATVTEDITGAIADSINFAIDQLRSLVTSINEASVQVASASQETQATAMHLAEASDHQAQQITGASTAINEMAVSIEDVSKNAAESAEVAEASVGTARTGAEAVQRTITGMDTIREQIQETSKRIKRLGESSQEIGDIVELINDIADQTNILALNAAIQAAMAGESGRGFAVVADEVQRLAERSSNATKQIEALVKTIQTDTNEAVISMEQSTSNVVAGARLAEDAGKALGEIESVSQNLADLIHSISNTARQQAQAATNISETMNVIQEITTQTSAGTNETATSIGNLAELANELRKSVSGFKIPE